MTTYKITIKDNSIPEHFLMGYPYKNEYTAIIESNTPEYTLSYLDKLNEDIKEYIQSMATELDTDPESLEILSIIKQ